MKLMAALMLVWSAAQVCRAGDRELLAQKTEYVAKADAATSAYLKALSGEVRRLTMQEDVANALRLSQHRGAFLLGIESPDAAVASDATTVSDEYWKARETYMQACSEQRRGLESRYEAEINLAAAEGNLTRAQQLRSELAALRAGDYAPSAAEVARKKPFVIGRYVGEKSTFVPLSDPSVPDELTVESQSQRFRIRGTCRHDVVRLAGKRCGHFGKAVIFEPSRARVVELRGYFKIASQADENVYAVGVAQGNTMTTVLRLDDLDVDTVYEWRVSGGKDALQFDVLREGTVVKTGTVPLAPRTSIAFYATVRYVGNGTDFVVAVDE